MRKRYTEAEIMYGRQIQEALHEGEITRQEASQELRTLIDRHHDNKEK